MSHLLLRVSQKFMGHAPWAFAFRFKCTVTHPLVLVVVNCNILIQGTDYLNTCFAYWLEQSTDQNKVQIKEFVQIKDTADFIPNLSAGSMNDNE